MTDRHAGYIVVLDQNIREDDAQPILDAIKLIKHVVDVRPVVAEPGAYCAAHRGRLDTLASLSDWLVAEYRK